MYPTLVALVLTGNQGIESENHPSTPSADLDKSEQQKIIEYALFLPRCLWLGSSDFIKQTSRLSSLVVSLKPTGGHMGKQHRDISHVIGDIPSRRQASSDSERPAPSAHSSGEPGGHVRNISDALKAIQSHSDKQAAKS